MNIDFNFWITLGIIIAGIALLWYVGKKFWAYIVTFLMWLKSSMEENGKASAKKITAFWFCFIVTVYQIRYLWYCIKNDKFELFMDVLYVDIWFIGSLLSVKLVAEAVGKFGKKQDPPASGGGQQ